MNIYFPGEKRNLRNIERWKKIAVVLAFFMFIAGYAVGISEIHRLYKQVKHFEATATLKEKVHKEMEKVEHPELKEEIRKKEMRKAK